MYDTAALKAKSAEPVNSDTKSISHQHEQEESHASMHSQIRTEATGQNPYEARPRVFHNFHNIPVHSTTAITVQPKLSINTPGDKYEEEADAMADKVMRIPETPLLESKQVKKQKENLFQSKQLSIKTHPDARINEQEGSRSPLNSLLSSKISNSQGRGHSMDSVTECYMANRFGVDFSNVKIHADNESIQMNHALNARAFTVGSDIYFNKAEYNPGSGNGRHLLAHELTHVIQQGGCQKKNVYRKEGDEDGADISLGILDNNTIGKGVEEIVGHTQWIILKEFLRGILAGVKFMPPEQKLRIETKFKEQGFVDSAKYAAGYAIGIVEGIGSAIYGLAEAVITLIKLPYTINKFLITTVPDLAAKYGPRILTFMMEGGGLEQQLRNAVNKFMQNPRQNLNQIRSMLDAVGSMALSKVRQLGRGVAEKTLAFLEEPWYQFGRDIGKVVGQILFEVILALASEAIANVVKEALAVVSRLTARLVTGAMDLIRSAGRLVGEAFEWIGRLGSKLAGEMGEMFESVRTFLSKLRALLMELGEDAALADTGIGERMPIPGAKPPVLESRALKPPVRTSPAKVSDLTPPKIHASNIPKEAPVPKREPFANDPDFHQGIKEMEDVPGTTNSEPLKDPLTTEPLEPRTRKQAGVSLEEDHHIASRYVKKNKPIFENAGVHIDDDLNLIKDFPEHGQLRGWYDWQNRSYRFNMRGHHPQYNSWITDTLTKAAPPGLPPDQALQRILQANQKLESIIRQYPEVLSHGPGILPKHLQNLTF